MLKYRITHPELIGALGKVGHGSQILIVDSNYAIDVNVAPSATRIYLNFTAGMLKSTDVLPAICASIPIEAAQFMLMENGEEAPIISEFRPMLPQGAPFTGIRRLDFYEAGVSPKTSIAIITGEQRLYACLMLTVGYIQPDGTAHY